MFTVVVGVAAIVGLQLTADTPERSPTTSVRTLLGGDIAVTKSGNEEAGACTEGELAGIQARLDEGVIDGYTVRGNPSDLADFAKFETSILVVSPDDFAG